MTMAAYADVHPDEVIELPLPTTLVETAPQATGDHLQADRTGFVLQVGTAIPVERVLWLWERRLPLGGASLLPGREGLGKSTLAYNVGARATRGQLEGDLFGEPCDIVVIGCEDALGAVVVPRLIAAGADLDRCYFLESTDPDAPSAFSAPVDVPALDRLLGQLANPRLVIVDPLDAHLGVDTHKKADTQRAIGTLARVAQRHALAVVGIAHHSKAPTLDALDRVNGSKAFTTAVRSVLTIAPHPDAPDGDERVVAVSKANLTRRDTIPVLKFRIEGCEITHGDLTVSTSRVVWLGEATGVDPDRVLASPGDDREDSTDAASTLATVLEDGPLWAKEAFDAMAAAGFSKDQAKRAKAKLRVTTSKVGAPGDADQGWKWSLPPRRERQEVEGSGSECAPSSHPSLLPSDDAEVGDAP
jgi:hypothetical protein